MNVIIVISLSIILLIFIIFIRGKSFFDNNYKYRITFDYANSQINDLEFTEIKDKIEEAIKKDAFLKKVGATINVQFPRLIVECKIKGIHLQREIIERLKFVNLSADNVSVSYETTEPFSGK
jgi:hypothetical protein